jgi:F420-dependent oxidoreductase-like protein
MRFAVWPDQARPWTEIAAIAEHAEATGWDGLYVYDHFMPHTDHGGPDDGPVLEGWTVLTAIAMRTSRLRLGSMVLGMLYRHPAVLANMAATLDRISDGRLVLGVGAGWQANEHAAYGIDLPDAGPRLDRFEEACVVLTSLLREPRTTYDGRYYTLVDAPCEPKPVQDPLPLLIGGRGERRTMRIAAMYADEWNAWTTPDLFRHKAAVLDRHCADIGRDPATIRRSTQAVVTMTDRPVAIPYDADTRPQEIAGTPEQLVEVMGEYARAGLDEFLVPDDATVPLVRRLEMLDRFRAEVAAQVPG